MPFLRADLPVVARRSSRFSLTLSVWSLGDKSLLIARALFYLVVLIILLPIIITVLWLRGVPTFLSFRAQSTVWRLKDLPKSGAPKKGFCPKALVSRDRPTIPRRACQRARVSVTLLIITRKRRIALTSFRPVGEQRSRVGLIFGGESGKPLRSKPASPSRAAVCFSDGKFRLTRLIRALTSIIFVNRRARQNMINALQTVYGDFRDKVIGIEV